MSCCLAVALAVNVGVNAAVSPAVTLAVEKVYFLCAMNLVVCPAVEWSL